MTTELPPHPDPKYSALTRSQFRHRRRVQPRSNDPRLQAGFGTLSDVLDAFPDELKRRREVLQPVTTYSCGVSLQHDKQRCSYRISFEPSMSEAEFKAFFAEHLKPLLIERHLLQGGPEVRFHFQPATRDWVMRYLHVAVDAEGREIVENGKPKWVSCHRQVQAIAERVVEQAAAILNEQRAATSPRGRES